MSRIRIEVTADLIKTSRRGDPCRCAVARAMKRAGLRGAWVGGMGWGALAAPGWRPLSNRLQRWIAAYDARKKVKPIRAAVLVPEVA